ncbi:MAG: hypothetical protein QHH24_06025 [Candidatus Bathyarchaeota archaeon]|nr:hypothetical protein [Candidatus Bathyarchaeota archaeon]
MSFSDKWVWITIAGVVLVIVLPLIVIWGILSMSPEFRMLATVGIVLVWGIVSGYKDWIISQQKEETQKAAEG